MNFATLLLLLLAVRQRHVEDALFDKVVIVERTLHLLPSGLIILTQILILLPLRRTLVEHIGVKERADVFIVSLEALQDQKRWDNKEDLSLARLELLAERLMLFTGGFDDRAEVNQLMTFLVVHEIGEALRPSVFKFN